MAEHAGSVQTLGREQGALNLRSVTGCRAQPRRQRPARSACWPLAAVAWTGDVCAVILIAIRAWRLVFNPDALHDEHAEDRVQE